MRQPWITTLPPRLSTAAISRSGPKASARVRANAVSTRPWLKSDEPRITWVAPLGHPARPTVRIPPPTRQGSSAQMCVTRSSLSPASLAASRSISCTFGIPWNREIHDWMSVVSTASFSPCTSCTMRPPWRSMDGINMVAPESRARVNPPSSFTGCSEKWNTKPPAPHRPGHP